MGQKTVLSSRPGESYRPVVIQVSSKVAALFKKGAKESFPNETFAYLLGHKETGRIVIDDLFFPTNVDKFCGRSIVKVQVACVAEAKRYAKKNSMMILGDIHSHPYNKKEVKIYNADTSPSEGDWNRSKADYVMAICLVTECQNRNLRARTKFWGPIPEVKVKETK